MAVTDKGEQTLAAHWRTCLGFYMDVDSVLRAATTALLMGDQKAAYHYLLNAADDYERRSRGPHAGHPDYQDSLVDWYGCMRAQWETARLQSAAQTLRNIRNRNGGVGGSSTQSQTGAGRMVGKGHEEQIRKRLDLPHLGSVMVSGGRPYTRQWRRTN